MTVAVALLNLLLGTVYSSYGIMTAIEMKRDWRTLGFSHFGAAWIAMAFTCGPHHLAHGMHLAIGGGTAGPLDLAYVLFGLPAGAIWFLLRIEAFTGGRGDRFISGTPGWVGAMPAVGLAYSIAFGAAAIVVLRSAQARLLTMVTPNLLLLGLYVTIGYFLFRTQLRNRASVGGWSVSGCSLGIVFPTCGVMHTVWALYAVSGLYSFDKYGLAIDWLAVPAAAYFLWVVHGLYREALQDWNTAARRPAILVG